MKTWEITEWKQAPCVVVDTRKMRKEVKKALKSGTAVKVAGLTVILLTTPQVAFAAGFESNAMDLYKKLLGIGKWVIIFKGAIETIKAVADGDTDKAKSSLIRHLVPFIVLMALPHAMNAAEDIFDKSTRSVGGE
jgi:hypothetical protein